MKQITYEEAFESYKNVDSLTGWGVTCAKDEEDIEIVRNYINQYKPPTFDEVVKDWEDNGYIVSVNFDDPKEITSVMQRGSGGLKHIAFNFDEFFIAFGQFVHDLTFEELQAINLTIRYLEAKEKEND